MSKNYYSWLTDSGVVNGIFYQPNQEIQTNVDIYELPIDLENIVPSEHDKIQINPNLDIGYQPRFANVFSSSNQVHPQPVIQQTGTGTESEFVTTSSVNSNSEPTQHVAQKKQMRSSQIPDLPRINQSAIIAAPVVSTISSSLTKPSSHNEEVWNSVWNKYGSLLGLKDEKAYAYILGQIKHESGNFKYMEEIADGSKYESRTDLGNIKRGDGKRYKGRGPIQVTGRNNYTKIYNDFFVPNGLGQYDIVSNPELAKDPYIGSLLSLGWLAVTNSGKNAVKHANEYNIKATTYAINGGYNGLDSRIKFTNELLAKLA